MSSGHNVRLDGVHGVREHVHPVLWNAFKKPVADASASEKAALFHDTASRVYRLG